MEWIGVGRPTRLRGDPLYDRTTRSVRRIHSGDITMNLDQVLSIVRAILQILGTTLVSRGLILSEADWTTISGGVLMVVPVAWSIWANRKTAKIARVAAMPE